MGRDTRGRALAIKPVGAVVLAAALLLLLGLWAAPQAMTGGRAKELAERALAEDRLGLPEGGDFPELLKFRSQKDYIREILKSVRLTGVEEGWEELDKVPDGFRYFGYNARTNGNLNCVGTHLVIDKTIAGIGKDWRLQDKDHPIRALSDRKKDNVDIARVKGK